MTDPSEHWRQPSAGYGVPGPYDAPLAAPYRGGGRPLLVALVLLVVAGAGAVAVVATRRTVHHAAAQLRFTGPPVTARPLRDESIGWTSLGLKTSCDTFGNWHGTARVRNDLPAALGVAVEYDLIDDGTVVAALRGAAPKVAPNATATITLFSTDKCEPTRYRTRFRVISTF